ncbi:MAG TPA: hemerythrin domain-containing protein [Kineosporiaceae bacterium]|nr:hemerythrin domain-containing protein [Kineosporiaceae bacterium]
MHLRDALDQLGARSPLFQLKLNCLRYCELVHAHHGAEDRSLFPAVRASAPELSAVIDRLEADHRVVADLLDQIEAIAPQLDSAETTAARERLAAALTALSGDLLEHLDVEERLWLRSSCPGRVGRRAILPLRADRLPLASRCRLGEVVGGAG